MPLQHPSPVRAPAAGCPLRVGQERLVASQTAGVLTSPRKTIPMTTNKEFFTVARTLSVKDEARRITV